MLGGHLLAVSVGNVKPHRLDVCEVCTGNGKLGSSAVVCRETTLNAFATGVLWILAQRKLMPIPSFTVLFANAYFFAFCDKPFDINEL